MDANANAVAGAVIKHRRAIGLSQRSLAALLGVHHNTISNWERGVTQPSPHQLAVLRYLSDVFPLPANVNPGGVDQAISEIHSLLDTQACLKTAKEYPAIGRLRRTLAGLADPARIVRTFHTIAEGFGEAGANLAARLLEESVPLADAAVAATQARLDAAEGCRSVRDAAGYTLTEIAELLQVTVQTWRRWEGEKVTPQAAKVRTAEHIAARLAAAADAADPGITGALTRLDAAVADKAAAVIASLAGRSPGRHMGSSPTWRDKFRRLWSRWWPAAHGAAHGQGSQRAG